MSKEFSAPRLIAIWQSEISAWIKPQTDLFSEQWVLYQDPLPKLATTANGRLYELPMPVLPMAEPEYLYLATPQVIDSTGGAKAPSKAVIVKLQDQAAELAFNNGLQVSPAIELELMRTPSVTDGTGGAISEKQARDRGRMVKIADQVVQLAFENGLTVSPSITASLLPTPTVAHMRNHDEPVENYLERRQDYLDGKVKGMPGASLGVAVRMELLGTPRTSSANGSTPNQVNLGAPKARLEDQVQLLPTVTTQDGKNNGGPSQFERNSLPLNAQVLELLPTPTTMEHREIKSAEQIAELKSRSPGGYRNLREVVINDQINWGKYEMAIRRWEIIMGRPAPDPTNPDGKNGAHRLSSKFTEWMMGLPEGWITGLGLTRNEELKACGNGVVPQQAMLALEILGINQILERQNLQTENA